MLHIGQLTITQSFNPSPPQPKKCFELKMNFEFSLLDFKVFWIRKYFGPKNFLDKDVFLIKTFWGPKFCGTQNILVPKIFYTKICLTKTFSDWKFIT